VLWLSLLVGLFVLWRHPSVFKLDTYRTLITAEMSHALNRPLTIGRLDARWLPTPRIVARDVVIPAVDGSLGADASASAIELRLYARALLQRQVRLQSLRLEHPRIYLRSTAAFMQMLPRQSTAPAPASPLPVVKDSYRLQEISFFDAQIEARDTTSSWWNARVDGRVFLNSLSVRIDLSRLDLARLPQVRWRVEGDVSSREAVLLIQTEKLSAPMQARATVRWTPQGAVDADVDLSNYSPELTPLFLSDAWSGRLRGPGRFRALISKTSGAQSLIVWSANGSGFSLDRTDFQVQALKIQGDRAALRVQSDLVTPSSGTARVEWVQEKVHPYSTAQVSMSSVTLREVLSVFGLQSRGREIPAHEKLVFTQADVSTQIHPRDVLQVRSATATVLGGDLQMTGRFGLRGSSDTARIQGILRQFPVEPLLKHFFIRRPAAMTGNATVQFRLGFPLAADWLPRMNGQLEVTARDGVVRSFETAYKVMTVLNLTNFVKLKTPRFHEDGIPFVGISGSVAIRQGILESDRLFIRTPNTNIALSGIVDLPAKELDLTVRVQILKFVEEVFKAIPGISWLFKDKQKILLPLIVKVQGPWKNADVSK